VSPPTASNEPSFTPSLDSLLISVPPEPNPSPPFLTLPEVKKVATVSQLIESALLQKVLAIEEKEALIGFGALNRNILFSLIT